MAEAVAGIVMAAGKGTRMKSALPKAAHPVCGKPMTRHVVDACRASGVQEVVVVVGHEAASVKAAIGDDVLYALQAEQLGTGHACAQAMPRVPSHCRCVLVLPGDAPLIRPETLRTLLDEHLRASNAATLLTAVLDDAAHYGRVLRAGDGGVVRVLEARDAGPEELAVREINTSVYCFDTAALAESLSEVRTDNAQQEYYLTDTIGILSSSRARVGAVVADDFTETLGINNRVELAASAAAMRQRIANELMLSGVSIIDPGNTCIDCDVTVGSDSVIHPFTVIERGCCIGSGCEIGPFVRLKNAVVPDGAKVVGNNG